jgi:hypothetical protein
VFGNQHGELVPDRFVTVQVLVACRDRGFLLGV